METLQSIIEGRLRLATGHPEAEVTRAADPRFGDYQTNLAMLLAKKERRNPREVAGELIAKIDLAGLCETPEIAGAGFINFRLKREALEAHFIKLLSDGNLGVPKAADSMRIVIDFSSPNIAKPMHVGHIRGTILGDALARVARFLGHEVVTDNHLGDWGTQFGKVIYGYKKEFGENLDALSNRDAIAELVRIYKEITALAERGETVMAACRDELVKLQRGDPVNVAIWKVCVDYSWRAFEKLYRELGIEFDAHLGESAYNDRLAPLVKKLRDAGIAEESEGAICVFFREDPALADKPSLVQKSDGGFLYATTDLATIEYRIERWQLDAIWYVVGAPQNLHFEQVFAVAKKMGITAKLRFIPFGSILGTDRKLMRTRTGENVQLADLLTEARERARAIVAQKNPELPAGEMEEIARVIGLGAVKYAELSQHRMTDYIFSWDKMLSFQGNTAPYLQNAYVRIRSIFRKAGDSAGAAPSVVNLVENAEIALAKKLAQFGETVPQVLDDFRPNILANYLYELADIFHGFYESCPVLKSEGVSRETRLALCDCTARILKTGLGLLGIEAPGRM